MEGISCGGGAGGARADHASPYAAVMLLKQMASRPEGEVYRKALPIVGVDGTPASAVSKESLARGKFQAKTGSLSWTNGLADNSVMTSKALAGYGVTVKGRHVLFAFFVNNVLVGEDGTLQAGRDLGRLCEIVHAME
jgi:D-alanyl-D-alanine carboxypeptidase/D-alanyl-D-alanine-endopeptidase (penicillin-binding protein 4)